METAQQMDIRDLHQRMGKVNSQPISVTSFTNKRFTVNYRVPLDDLRRVVPEAVEVEEIRDSGFGLLSMCACDFWVSRLGVLPIVPIRNNDMLCRVSVKVRKNDKVYRAYYTLRSDSSSRLLGFCGSHFSHYRKQRSHFVRLEDENQYCLDCRSRDPLCGGSFKAMLGSITMQPPAETLFADRREATDFVFQLDGSCGYNYERNMLSFQSIAYPPWDIAFCHEYSYHFPLIEYLCSTFQLQATLDCVLFMQNVPQVWRAAWLYSAASGGRLTTEKGKNN